MDEETHMMNMAIIAGASAALSYKDKNPAAFTPEIMQHVSDSLKSIREGIDRPE